ncbi:hypothetical protein [Ornithinimicrobium cryptoxanthini]|uniref:Uncharacterized protein n=1 Tax=Ornithinimicrobium cryptoxanthini TaxID=2934161 RepID=A0ABY4YKV2_9MICO|nr:hypothetical protein [Ornithinimicrobium cryptoxanthini]USQ77333.1 hypothetical protein NF557_05320 [Ornithinimicrobium cryptoxanthini]
MTEPVEEFSNIRDLLDKTSEIDYSTFPAAFVRDAYDVARMHVTRDKPIGLALAALFDLAVTALYLERVPTDSWYYCDAGSDPYLVYPFVNACPTCTLNGSFIHLRAGKPQSASIGKATSTIISAFLDRQAKYAKGASYEVRTLSDNGMVDAVLLGPQILGLFEIKSAPLMPFPIVIPTTRLTVLDDDIGEVVPKPPHTMATTPNDQSAHLIIDPQLTIPVGSPHRFTTQDHYSEILEWLADIENFHLFTDSWGRTFEGYANAQNRSQTYWLTNGCGTPSPRPEGWPRRTGQGYESISDGKSSVGLDRTDDVKKGIYQVLKISTHYKEFFPSGQRDVFAALVSNIHAVKHHDDYLGELEDLVWTLDGQTRSYVIARNEAETVIETPHLYNLFDALICFTRSHFRNRTLEEIYAFGN